MQATRQGTELIRGFKTMDGVQYERVVSIDHDRVTPITALYRVLRTRKDGSEHWAYLNPGVHRKMIRRIERAMGPAQ